MHLLLTAIGSYGDVHPMIGLGVAMRERGHDVTVITNPYFTDEVIDAGLLCEPVSSVEEYHELTSHPDIWHSRRSVALVFRWAAERLLRPVYERVVQLYRPGETVIAAHPLDVASRIVHESLGAPVVLVFFAPMTMWSDRQPPRMAGAPVGPVWPRWWNSAMLWAGEQMVMRRYVRPQVAAVRQGLGLPPVGRLFPDWWFATGRSLGLFPEWFMGSQGLPEDWPSGVETTGFLLWDGAAKRTPQAIDPELESWLQRDESQRPIVFTPGTANRDAARFFREAVDACGRLGRPALLLTKFPEQLPSHLPVWARHASFVPLSQVLPHAGAFVHHGGIGSCSQGLAGGVPQLIHPLAYDQADNAHRLEQLGVGGTLIPKVFTGRTAAKKLEKLLDSKSVDRSCERAAARCDAGAARSAACDYFERLATEIGLE